MNHQKRNTLFVLASFTAKTDKVEELKLSLIYLISPTRKEAGCLQYDLHQDNENSAAFFLYERWSDKKALDKHLQQTHMKDFFASSENLLKNPVDIKTAHLIT